MEAPVVNVQEVLHSLRDVKYRDFQAKLIPTVSQENIIGVRTPALRQLARKLYQSGQAESFLSSLPHRYFEEDQLHAFIISLLPDYGQCAAAVGAFLPYVNNWATCDQMSPKVFQKHRQELAEQIKCWLASESVYSRRFAIKMLMDHFLDKDFSLDYMKLVAQIRSDEYYINMMIAWYFATALAKQPEAAMPFLEGKCLSDWTHNKAVQKAIESRRISLEMKNALRMLKI
ncbi:3-methyladenine DNA glycosylase AlkD [Selenomonas ruminantium]|uniref:3-methyladenine DNA glycosylase AlkD n=1 Tax=Selenomonas ruminantium TaxID=971 RepID=A0A1M6XDB9_SELRU|nr:DNA alkylation repair protein [Selenomonas ruminantium]SHL03921.1 3-methyladenine DNA glycosylase AlkD [Selenomonas ruminantium]